MRTEIGLPRVSEGDGQQEDKNEKALTPADVFFSLFSAHLSESPGRIFVSRKNSPAVKKCHKLRAQSHGPMLQERGTILRSKREGESRPSDSLMSIFCRGDTRTQHTCPLQHSTAVASKNPGGGEGVASGDRSSSARHAVPAAARRGRRVKFPGLRF